jgi:hypothetical protein
MDLPFAVRPGLPFPESVMSSTIAVTIIFGPLPNFNITISPTLNRVSKLTTFNDPASPPPVIITA